MSLPALPTGRRSKYAVLLAALLLVAALGSLAGRLGSVMSSDPADALPRAAESRSVARLVARFPSSAGTVAVAVVRRDAGLTADDRAWLTGLRGSLRARPLPASGAVPPPEVSRDGTSATLVTALRSTDDAVITRSVTALRDRLRAGRPPGLRAAVTGPAAVTTDLSKVFDGADGRLLLLTSLLVVVLLILNYRSPVFWLIPFATVLLAELANRGVGYLLGSAGLTVDPAGSGIASVLVFGAATDYALLLVARYREELRVEADTHVAMRRALRRAGPAIVASGLTVATALLVLLLCRVGGTRAIGPLSATGVLLATSLSVTLLPAALLIAGRRAFWPRIPRPGRLAADLERGAWARVGARVARHPRRVWLTATAGLLVAALGLTRLPSSLGEDDQFTVRPEAVRGAVLLARAFPSGLSSPADVVVPDARRVAAVRSALERRRDLVAGVQVAERGAPGTRLSVVLRRDPLSAAGLEAIPDVRRVVHAAGGPGAGVGGPTAEQYDLRRAALRDTTVVVPVALLVIGAILAVLLRALVLPALLLLSVVVSFAASLGIGAVVFDRVLGFGGADPTLPLLAFVFLTALGVDYNIFLTARTREEAPRVGTRPAVLTALAATGAVITSAGVVLAGTFSILGVLPLVVLAELGFVIALGVLLDTLVVRTLVIPALILDLGSRVWWPSALAADEAPTTARRRRRRRVLSS